jgi:Transglycosylase SLT domain
MIAWGAKVSPDFLLQVKAIATDLDVDPSWLMACMAFESGETFSPAIRNAAGSGAIGLIQFMPSTAAALGTTVEALGSLTAVQQLNFVWRYFSPWRNRMKNLGDVYGAILWPGMVGKTDGYVLFNKNDPDHPARYRQNAGLDFNHDGLVTRAEALAAVQAKLTKGLAAGYVA